MAESNVWGTSRSITLLLVLATHLIAIALLVMGSRTSAVLASAEPPIELMLLSPAAVPKVRIESVRPRRVSADLAVPPAPPAFDAALPAAPPSASDTGNGGGQPVNWAAEAHRAIQAYEIRRDQHVIHTLVGASAWDGWLPKRDHHPGERYRTDAGDWIVWINADCYQVASWHAGAPPQNPAQPQTICVSDGASPQNPSDPSASKKR